VRQQSLPLLTGMPGDTTSCSSPSEWPPPLRLSARERSKARATALARSAKLSAAAAAREVPKSLSHWGVTPGSPGRKRGWGAAGRALALTAAASALGDATAVGPVWKLYLRPSWGCAAKLGHMLGEECALAVCAANLGDMLGKECALELERAGKSACDLTSGPAWPLPSVSESEESQTLWCGARTGTGGKGLAEPGLPPLRGLPQAPGEELASVFWAFARRVDARAHSDSRFSPSPLLTSRPRSRAKASSLSSWLLRLSQDC
jgi:hypothetical protein